MTAVFQLRTIFRRDAAGNLVGDCIPKVKDALKTLSNNKSPNVDRIPEELLRARSVGMETSSSSDILNEADTGWEYNVEIQQFFS